MHRLIRVARGINWRFLAVGALWTINAVYLAVTISAFFFADIGSDWLLFTEAGRRVFEGGLYDWPDTPWSYRYSPLLAYFFAAVTPVGYLGWSALHFLALAAIPRRLGLLALISFPFWADIYNGGVMTFVFVAAVAGLAGSSLGTLAFFMLALLVPRPLMLPVMVWLLWHQPGWRLPFAALLTLYVAGVAATGWGPDWVMSLLERGADTFAARIDLGPANYIGVAWIPLGLALAAVLVLKGRLGWASMAASPAWLPYYFIMVLLELRQPPSTMTSPLSNGSTRLSATREVPRAARCSSWTGASNPWRAAVNPLRRLNVSVHAINTSDISALTRDRSMRSGSRRAIKGW